MADPIVFDLTSPATWLPSLAAAGLGIYGVIRVFRRDSRNDKQEKQIDEAVQQIITNLRDEVERLTERMTNMEAVIVHLHEERAVLLARVAECEAANHQPRLL